jgi:hypothetical protein
MARNFSLVANVRLAPHLPNILVQLRLRVSIKEPFRGGRVSLVATWAR